MTNMANLIKSHNRKVLRSDQVDSDGCNCRKRSECPLEGKCLATNVIYQAKVIQPDKDPRLYIRMAETEFKTRFNNHKLSFRDKKYANKTALSKYVWEWEEENRDFKIQRSIKTQAKPYTSGTKTCNLCFAEKMEILKANKKLVLNKRSELISKCRHENKLYASNVT